MTPPNCPFCEILQHTKPATVLYEDEDVLAFQDIRPIAPAHILIIPKKHIVSLNDIQSQEEPLLGHLIRVGRVMAERAGVYQSGYRLVINTGLHAGQSVFHLHLHMIGGRHLPFRFE